MEKLEDLPVRDNAEMSPEENKLMETYFGASGSSTEKSHTWSDSAKTTGYAVVLFVALANPWIDSLLSRLPYVGDSSLNIFVTKSVAFMFIFFILYKFLI